MNRSAWAMSVRAGILCLLVFAKFTRSGESASPAWDLAHAVVVAPRSLSQANHRAVEMLVEEVERRSRIRWPIVDEWPTGAEPVIVVCLRKDAGRLMNKAGIDLLKENDVQGAEGFTLRSNPESGVIVIAGNDSRGILFGIGCLLRQLSMSRENAFLRGQLDISTAPQTALRGHQLGYRPKTNSYDGWDLPQWEQYIRDLAVFGTNAIELIPPRSDDDDDSPHFPKSKIDMMVGMSQIAADYGLSVWVWYPAMDADYSDPQTVEFALNEWGSVLSRLPRVDAVFVPSGDPGNAPPKLLMPMLEKQTKQLQSIHPGAEMWVSLQSFDQSGFDEMMSILSDEQTDWLTGVVFGPQTRLSLSKLRQILPARYPIRRYPDITHSLRCEFPVPAWDRAYAFTEAREVINPRPRDQAVIFHAGQSDAIGFLTYSEGCNDDVNKIVWSGLGWDSGARVVDILREYGRYYISDQHADDLAQIILALEENWRRPLLGHQQVMTTLGQAQDLEQSATPAMLANWRFQQLLYRAYYDAYIHCRLKYESEQEVRAMERLRLAEKNGVSLAMEEAEAIFDADNGTSLARNLRTLGPRMAMEEANGILALSGVQPVAGDLRARVFELGEALFQSIRMQLSVARYQAIDVGRGANLDTIDVPLNDRVWMKNRFEQLRQLDHPREMMRGIDEIVNWTNPGPGGFYDDLGDPERQPHLVQPNSYADDPGFLESPTISFHHVPVWRLSWCTHVDGLFNTPVQLRYDDLDGASAYKVRVVYAGDKLRARVRLVANEAIEIHPLIAKPFPVRPVEFDVPIEATRGGRLTLTWSSDPGRGGPGRGCQVAEVWLMKRPPSPETSSTAP